MPKSIAFWGAVALWLCLFVCLAHRYQQQFHGDSARPALVGSDAGNISSFVASLDHPEKFRRDALLGHPEYFRFYRTVHFPILRAWAKYRGDYASFFIATAGFHLALQMAGFFLLGLALFQRFPLAAALGLASAAPFGLPYGEFWGAWPNALPRVAFQSLLPFALALAVLARERPRLWPWLAGIFGSLLYVHPVSAPAWGLAFWISTLFLHPSAWSRRQRFTSAAVCAIAGLLPTLPFTWNYYGNHLQTPTVDYAVLHAAIARHFDAGFLDIPRSLLDFRFKYDRLTWLVGGVGLLLAWRFRPPGDKRLTIFAVWSLTLLGVSALLPAIEQPLFRHWQRMPLEYDLVRGLRYLIPLLLILWLWPGTRFQGRARPFAWLYAAFLTGTWFVLHPMPAWSFPPSPALTADREREATELDSLAAVLDSLKAMPPGTLVLPWFRDLSQEIAIRYHSRQPLVHSGKDAGILPYSDAAAMLRWDAKSRKLHLATHEQGLSGLLILAQAWQAQVVLVDLRSVRMSDSLTRPWIQHGPFALYRIESP